MEKTRRARRDRREHREPSDPNPLQNVINYDPEDFYVPAKDADGDKARVWAFIQPLHARQIAAYCQNPDIPYETNADFIRHAIRNQLAYLRQLPLPVVSVYSQAELIIQISRDAGQQIRFEETFRQMSATVGKFMASNNIPEAKKYLHLCANAIKDMPRGSWKDRYAEQFASQFSPYLKATGTKDLVKQLKPGKPVKPDGGE